ncbi:MAG: DnaJ domain-containing protein [Desulfobacteraceae bacterium]|nr:DnaJ domain-containing protein [Desulfobacteraceae bacterium]
MNNSVTAQNNLTTTECFRILELRPGAGRPDVKRAYKRLAKTWHPDRFSEDSILNSIANEKIIQINRAYETLINHPHLVSPADQNTSSNIGPTVGKDCPGPPTANLFNFLLDELKKSVANIRGWKRPWAWLSSVWSRQRVQSKRKDRFTTREKSVAHTSRKTFSMVLDGLSTNGAPHRLLPNRKGKCKPFRQSIQWRTRYRRTSGSCSIHGIQPVEQTQRVHRIRRVGAIGEH